MKDERAVTGRNGMLAGAGARLSSRWLAVIFIFPFAALTNGYALSPVSWMQVPLPNPRESGQENRERGKPNTGIAYGVGGAPVSSFDRRKDAVERVPGQGAICRKVASICCKDFRVRRLIGKRDNAGVGQSRVEVGILLKPEEKVFRMEPNVEICAQIAIYDHLEHRLRISYHVGGLSQNRHTCQQWSLLHYTSRPSMVGISPAPVGDEKTRVSDLRHDASPPVRASSLSLGRRDRGGGLVEEDKKPPLAGAGSSRARLSGGVWRANQAMLVAPRLGEPSRHPQSRRDSYPKANAWLDAGQVRSAQPVPPEPRRRRRGRFQNGKREAK
jgi:hypothetical protein